MSHEIANVNGQNAIAYVGQTPWHGLGQRLQPGCSIDVWQREAGLLWTAEKSQVRFNVGLDENEVEYAMKNRHVLYRSDTKHPLSVVSSRYQPVQPRAILEWFDAIAKAGGFELETAGALNDGERVWALAKVGDGANVIGQDRVLPYLLLATSYDGTMATTARFTNIRVVCNNTITMALRTPADKNSAAKVVSSVTVPHSTHFDGQAVRDQLGIVNGAFAQFMDEASTLAEKGLNDKQVGDVIYSVVAPRYNAPKGVVVTDALIRDSKGFRAILDLFKADSVDNKLSGGANAWTLLNAFTRYVDHDRGRSRDSGLKSAWFGDGNAMKNEAREALLAV